MNLDQEEVGTLRQSDDLARVPAWGGLSAQIARDALDLLFSGIHESYLEVCIILHPYRSYGREVRHSR